MSLIRLNDKYMTLARWVHSGNVIIRQQPIRMTANDAVAQMVPYLDDSSMEICYCISSAWEPIDLAKADTNPVSLAMKWCEDLDPALADYLIVDWPTRARGRIEADPNKLVQLLQQTKKELDLLCEQNAQLTRQLDSALDRLGNSLPIGLTAEVRRVLQQFPVLHLVDLSMTQDIDNWQQPRVKIALNLVGVPAPAMPRGQA